MSCTGNKQWYVCTKGSFRGCCSSDPCTTGVCPDDKSGSSSNPVTSSTSSSTTSSTNSSSTTTATKPTTSFKTGSDASATAVLSSSSLPPTETITAAPESATTTGSSSSSSSGGGVSKGLIGGVVVGSVVALLLLVGILLLIYYRSRKKHGKGFMLLGWYKPQYSRGQGQQQQRAGRGGCCGSDSEKPAVEGTGDYLGSGQPTTLSPCNCYSTLSSVQKAETPISISTTTPSATGGNTPNSATRLLAHTPPSITSSPERQFQPHQTTAKARPPLETIPSLTLIHSQGQEQGNEQRRQVRTPELGDTGFYRPRAELATHSQSELINVSREERVRRQYRPPPAHETTTTNTQSAAVTGPGPGPGQDAEQGATETLSKHIVTPDGAVLAANFERASPGSREHATSFAQGYDAPLPFGLGIELGHGHGSSYWHGAEDGNQLPAYYPSPSMKMEGINEGLVNANTKINGNEKTGVHKI